MAESTFKGGTGTGTTPPGLKPKGGKGGMFNKVVFGMPLWAWIAILAGAVILALYFRSRNAEAAYEEPAEDTWEQDTIEQPSLTDDGVSSDSSGYAGSDGFDEFIEYEDEADSEDDPADPRIVVNVNQQGQTGNQKGCGKRPVRKAKKGHKWVCKNGKWQQTKVNNQPKPNKKPGQKSSQAKTTKPKAKAKRSIRPGSTSAVVVGGGAPNKVPVRTKPVATAKKKVVAKKQPAKKKK